FVAVRPGAARSPGFRPLCRLRSVRRRDPAQREPQGEQRTPIALWSGTAARRRRPDVHRHGPVVTPGMALLKPRAALVTVSGALWLDACASPVPAPSVTGEEARRITAEFQGQSFTAPPRTVTALVRALDALGPNPELLARWHAAANAQPPGAADAATLAAFYLNRSYVALRIGRVEQQLDDLRAAAKHAAHAGLPYPEFRVILRAPAF